MEQPLDLGPVVNALPFSPQVKATILFMLPFAYFGLMIARRFTAPTSKPGALVRTLLSGWKHPDEQPIPLVKEAPAAGKGSSATPPALLALLAAGLLLAAPARADDVVPPGLLPQAGTCSAKGMLCVSPAVAVIPYVIDFRSGNIDKDVAFGLGYGLTFPKAFSPNFIPGADFLFGSKTSGGWIAAVMGRIGPFRLGLNVKHNPGTTYAGLGFGAGY
jgi:hypothetical protein